MEFSDVIMRKKTVVYAQKSVMEFGDGISVMEWFDQNIQ